MKLAILIAILLPTCALAQFAVRYLGPNTNGISETFPVEVREGVSPPTIPAGFSTNLTRAQLEALQAATVPAMEALLKSRRDTNDLAVAALQSQIRLDLTEVESAVTNWRNLTTQQKDSLSLTRLRLEANRSILASGDAALILQRSRDTNSVPERIR